MTLFICSEEGFARASSVEGHIKQLEIYINIFMLFKSGKRTIDCQRLLAEKCIVSSYLPGQGLWSFNEMFRVLIQS